MDISGHTVPYAVLGHPIGHSLSPVMHNAAFRKLGLDAIYLAFDVHPDRLLEVLPAMGAMGFGGVNLTVPLKEVAFRGLDDLDETAQRFGAVNTVAFRDGGLRGYNTDGQGFVLALEEAFGGGVAGRSVFVLGTGGAGRALAMTCAAEGAARVVVSDVDAERAQRVTGEIRQRIPGAEAAAVPPAGCVAACREADVVIQATPVGMHEGDASPLPPSAFREGQWAFDLIYMVRETVFMRAAGEGGAACANGLGMLLHQGAHAFTIWTGRPAAVDAMRAALETRVYGAD